MTYFEKYKHWLEQATGDADIIRELKQMGDNESKIEDAFFQELTFGTGGLRGIIGAGTNRMNIYTVAKASKGLSKYLISNFRKPSVVIGYDSRIKSDTFAKTAAAVFAVNGVAVHIWPVLSPVSTVSFATHYLGASAGVMITASHNPSKYNGYKVYGADGCQITTEAAMKIMAEINELDVFSDVTLGDFDVALSKGLVSYISENVMTAFIDEVKKQTVLFGEEINKDVSIIYSPLNGTGLVPVTRTLNEMGYTNITVVNEQKFPDGNFSSCPYPNPEVRETMDLGIRYAKANDAELVLATDPDCDRVGVAVKDRTGEYRLLSGNETGMLLLDYICSQRMKHGMMPDMPVMIKTIVTTDMGEQIAANYNVKTINVLTGFKYIGEQIGFLEKQEKADSFIFGFEESYGYLSGTYVRDKDAVGGTYLVCEMFSYYKMRGISLLDKLCELYDKYGYCLNTVHSYQFEGSVGMIKMRDIMNIFREGINSVGGKIVQSILDYNKGLGKLPKSDVIKYMLEDNCSVVIRPSGTEPKLKAYISVSAFSKEEAILQEQRIVDELEHVIDK